MDLPFDQYQRYGVVADVLKRLGGGPAEILDVSGGENALGRFLPEDRISLAGTTRAGELPFDEGSFDYVVGTDVCGRVRPGELDAFLSGLRRVARRGVLLSEPFDSGVVRGAEEIADGVRRSLGAAGRTGGRLPALDGVRRVFEGHGDTVYVVPNGYVPHWLAMTSVSLLGAERGDASGELLRRINAFYNEFVSGMDNVEPSYRHLVVSLREPADVDLGGIVGGEPETGRAARDLDLSGALFAVLPLAAEVERLNARLSEKEGELARKEVQVDDLFGRLSGLVSAENAHRVHHSNLRRINRELREQIEHITGSRTWRILSLLRRIWLRVPGSG